MIDLMEGWDEYVKVGGNPNYAFVRRKGETVEVGTYCSTVGEVAREVRPADAVMLISMLETAFPAVKNWMERDAGMTGSRQG